MGWAEAQSMEMAPEPSSGIFGEKPAKAYKVENAFGCAGTNVVGDSHLRYWISIQSEECLPSTCEYSKCVDKYDPPIPTKYSFDSHPVRSNPEIVTADGRFVKPFPGSNA